MLLNRIFDWFSPDFQTLLKKFVTGITVRLCRHMSQNSADNGHFFD
jgi:hypothetical protein